MAVTTLNQRARQATRPNRINSRRVVWVLLFFLLFGVYNTYKVFTVQVVQHDVLSDKAESAIKWPDTIEPRRGLIYDSRGQLLAGNTTAHDVYVDISNHRDEKSLHKIADLLAPVLEQSPQDLYTRLKEAPKRVSTLKVAGRVDDTMVAKINTLVDDNSALLTYVVTMQKVPLRQYPGDALAASVLGFTDSENKGHYGVEEYYDAKLAGEAGWILTEHDAQNRPLVLEQPEMKPATDGSDLVLTIDSAVQYLAEQELRRSIDEFQADSGYLVVQDPNTGAILAMATWPTFNPNLYGKVEDYALFKNPVVNDVREPGSTMKILTYSSAIDAGAVLSTTTFYGKACDYKYGARLCNATFTEWGNESMLQGLGRSDNVAAMYAAEQLGPDKYYQYLKAFGVGRHTDIDLAGEVAGLVSWPGNDGYSPVDFYTTAFGMSAATTPIQLITAVSAVANGGMLLKPYVMKEIQRDGKVIEQNGRQEVRRVVKPETAHEIGNMLAYGVENKMVARLARVPGYHVSVKTGTADVASDKGGYTGFTFASAMGFAPTQNPQFTLYIGLMHPRTSPWGENTASVSWGRLAKQLLLYMKVQPTDPLPLPTPTP